MDGWNTLLSFWALLAYFLDGNFLCVFFFAQIAKLPKTVFFFSQNNPKWKKVPNIVSQLVGHGDESHGIPIRKKSATKQTNPSI